MSVRESVFTGDSVSKARLSLGLENFHLDIIMSAISKVFALGALSRLLWAKQPE